MDKAALILVVLIVAPAALVLLFAILRGYTVDMRLQRRRDKKGSEDE